MFLIYFGSRLPVWADFPSGPRQIEIILPRFCVAPIMPWLRSLDSSEAFPLAMKVPPSDDMLSASLPVGDQFVAKQNHRSPSGPLKEHNHRYQRVG